MYITEKDLTELQSGEKIELQMGFPSVETRKALTNELDACMKEDNIFYLEGGELDGEKSRTLKLKVRESYKLVYKEDLYFVKLKVEIIDVENSTLH